MSLEAVEVITTFGLMYFGVSIITKLFLVFWVYRLAGRIDRLEEIIKK